MTNLDLPSISPETKAPTAGVPGAAAALGWSSRHTPKLVDSDQLEYPSSHVLSKLR